MYRRLSPKKIKDLRGTRTRRKVVSVVENLSEQELYYYEKGAYKPSEDKLRLLLKALNCTWEDVSEPVDLQTI